MKQILSLFSPSLRSCSSSSSALFLLRRNRLIPSSSLTMISQSRGMINFLSFPQRTRADGTKRSFSSDDKKQKETERATIIKPKLSEQITKDKQLQQIIRDYNNKRSDNLTDFIRLLASIRKGKDSPRCHNRPQLQLFLSEKIAQLNQQPPPSPDKCFDHDKDKLKMTRQCQAVFYNWLDLKTQKEKRELLVLLGDGISIATISSDFKTYSEYFSILGDLRIPWEELFKSKENKGKDLLSKMILFKDDLKELPINEMKKLVIAMDLLFPNNIKEQLPAGAVSAVYLKLLNHLLEALAEMKEELYPMKTEPVAFCILNQLHLLYKIDLRISKKQLNLIYALLMKEWDQMNNHKQSMTIRRFADEMEDYQNITSDLWERMIEGLIRTMDKGDGKSVIRALNGLAKLNYKWKDTKRDFQETMYGSIQRMFDSSNKVDSSQPQAVSITVYSLGEMKAEWKELPLRLSKVLESAIILKMKEMKSQEVSNTILGLMNMNHNKYNQPEHLKEAIIGGLSAVMKGEPQAIANSIYGLSEMQWTWKDLILQHTQNQLIGMIILNERRFNMQDLSNIMYAISIMCFDSEEWKGEDFFGLHQSLLLHLNGLIKKDDMLNALASSQIAIYFETLKIKMPNNLLQSIGQDHLPLIYFNTQSTISPAQKTFKQMLEREWGRQLKDHHLSAEFAMKMRKVRFVMEYEGLESKVFPVDIAVVREEENNHKPQPLLIIEIDGDSHRSYKTSRGEEVKDRKTQLRDFLYAAHYPGVEIVNVASLKSQQDYDHRVNDLINKENEDPC